MNSTLNASASKVDMPEHQRLESFKLGWGAPLANSRNSRHSHARSHSRNASISSSISSFSFPSATTSHESSLSSSISASSLNPNPKRNSHHRRRSSVSTRHESAEIMGVSVPDLPPSKSSEDNINLGDKDSVRRRALWALEGKPDASFSKVEIPELSTPDIEKMMFDFPTKPSFPAFGGGSLGGLMGGKRDSFKLLGGSCSSKDQLHTLVEEEEEEEDNVSDRINTEAPVAPPSTPVSPVTPIAVVKPKPRPATLSLRPLSLTPEILTTVHGLPTPSSTPSSHSGLRSLSLASSLSSDDSPKTEQTRAMKRDSFTSPPPHRRPALNLHIAPTLSENVSASNTVDMPSDAPPARRSSISYKASSSGLPTPEMTPTFPRRRFSSSTASSSISSLADANGDDEFFPPSRQQRPLSASEQHFLFKSHNALLARIQDLERALSNVRRTSTPLSRPVSISSDTSEPNDEMLRLIADLKEERDELKRDVEGWRVRVGDLEKQISVLGGRLEAERREAWVARSKLGVAEAEKKVLEKQMAEIRVENERIREELRSAREEKKSAMKEMERWRDQAQSAVSLKREEEEAALATPTPQSFALDFVARRGNRGISFTSLDSSETAADDADFETYGFSLKAVNEADEDDEYNGLAGYEEEEEDDALLDCHSPASSFGSESELPARVHAAPITPVTPATPSSNDPTRTHTSRGSLSKTWSFSASMSKTKNEPETVDHFFGCLEDNRSSEEIEYSYERTKGLFTSAFGSSSNDDDSPFFFAAGVPDSGLDVVVEEDEDTEDDDASEMTQVGDDEDMFGDIGGIKITFTPPDDEESLTAKPVSLTPPAFDFEESDDEENAPVFNFGKPLISQAKVMTPPPLSSSPSSSSSSTGMSTPPSPIPRASAIPRLMKSTTPVTLPSFTLPSRHNTNIYSTPPAKCPSFIPQPSPRSNGTPTKQRPTTTFMRQPQRKPQSTHNDLANGSSFFRSQDRREKGDEMKSVDLSSPADFPAVSAPGPTFSSRISIQSFTSFWSPKISVGSTFDPPPKVFVSREAQLAKLKSRLAREGSGIFIGDVCKQCDGDAVYL